MFRDTILKRLEVDVKPLPLGAIEVFMLSQIDGTLTLEEIASIVGLDLTVASRVARRLVDLRVICTTEPPVRTRLSVPLEAPRSSSTNGSVKPPSSRRPPSSTKSRAVSSRPARSTRTSSMRVPKQEDCELDDATRAEITVIYGKLGSTDHYALLGVERSADKKAIKRAYTTLAAKFHPDRFFKKKLGSFRASLEKVFYGITVAHDVLVDRERRDAYDAKLAPMSEPPPTAKRSSPPLDALPQTPLPLPPLPHVSMPPMSCSPPRSSVEPPRPPESCASSRPRIRAADLSSSPRPLLSRAPVVVSTPPTPSVPPEDAMKRMLAKAKQEEKQRRMDVFLRAADDALKRNDVVSAANSFRLVLQNGEDPAVRKQLDAIEAAAKQKQHAGSLARAQVAERDGRWEEAATCYARVHALLPSVVHAERAAYALCKAGGDLHEAVKLAEFAVNAQPSTFAYQATLGEVYLAAKLWTRAARVAERALQLAPNDTRAKALAAAAKADR